jgi:sarcosine oxidase delta subunit
MQQTAAHKVGCERYVQTGRRLLIFGVGLAGDCKGCRSWFLEVRGWVSDA